MIGIKDVAQDVGLSIATVSRALRGQPGVSESNRDRVQQAAARLGYVPSRAASGLVTGRTHLVAAVVPFVTRWFFATVVDGAEEVLRQRGYDLLLFNLGGSREARARALLTHHLVKRVDALVILGLLPDQDEQRRLLEQDAKVVLVGTQLPGWASVSIDDERAASTAVSHLTSLGHRRIAFVGGGHEDALEFITPHARAHGYRRSLAAAGIADLSLEFDGDFTIAGGLAAGHRVLRLPDPPSAVFCASDEMAIGVLRAARELGVEVPSQLSVVGIDDHLMAQYFDLTTVSQPVSEQGRRAATRVLGLLDGIVPGGAAVEEQLDTHLIVRGSTGPPGRRPARPH